MPIDPRIPLSGNPIAIPAAPALQQTNPLGMIQTLESIENVRAQVEQRRALAEATRQKAIDEADVRRAFAAANGDPEAALTQLQASNPRAAFAIGEQVGKARKEAADAASKAMTLRTEQLKFGLNLTQYPTDQASWDTMLPALEAHAPEVARLAGKTYDPEAQKRLNGLLVSAKERNDLEHDAIKLFTDNKPLEAFATLYGNAQTPEDWTTATATARALHMPATFIAQFGGDREFSPDLAARAKAIAIGPTKAAELAGQAETRAQTRDYQTATLAGQAEGRAQTAANQAASQAIARGQLDVARGHLAVAQAAEKRQEQAKTAGGIKLSPTQQEDIATMLTVQQLGQEALRLGEQNRWEGVGPVEGRIGSTMAGYGGEKGEALRNKIGNIQGTIAKLRGGTSFTPNEQKLLESYTPTITDTDTKIKTKLKTLNEFIENKRKNTLRVAAGEYTAGPPAGATANADPMGIR